MWGQTDPTAAARPERPWEQTSSPHSCPQSNSTSSSLLFVAESFVLHFYNLWQVYMEGGSRSLPFFKTVLAWRLPVWRLSVFHLVISLFAKVLAILNKDILGRGYAPSYDSGCIVCCIFSSGLNWRQEPGLYSWPFCLIRHDDNQWLSTMSIVWWTGSGMVSGQT